MGIAALKAQKFFVIVIIFIRYRYRCQFEGTDNEVKDHLNTCKFEPMKEFLQHSADQIEKLQTELKNKDQVEN